MPFLIQCDNNKCLQHQAPRLNTTTNEAHCSECGEVIKNITPFAKSQLKFLGQTLKNVQATDTFSVKCPKCHFTGAPKIEADQFLCKSCCHELTQLTPFFKKMLLELMPRDDK